MKSSIENNAFWRWALVVCVAAWIAGMASAQTTQTEVRSGEVVYVSGNQLVVKMADGQVKTFNVPEGAHFNVDGKDVSVHELKPGTHLTQTIETTSTPRTVTTVRTISGRVWNVNAPFVILTLPDGTNKQYRVPDGTKFSINGNDNLTVFDLRKGMNVTATVTRTEPEIQVSQARSVTGRAPLPPPSTPPMVGVLLIEEAPAPAVAQAPPPAQAQPSAERQETMPEHKPAKLPKTGSSLPDLGLFGALSLSAGLLLRAGRRLWFG